MARREMAVVGRETEAPQGAVARVAPLVALMGVVGMEVQTVVAAGIHQAEPVATVAAAQTAAGAAAATVVAARAAATEAAKVAGAA